MREVSSILYLITLKMAFIQCNEPLAFSDSDVLSSREERICAKDEQVGCLNVSLKRKGISVHFLPPWSRILRERERGQEITEMLTQAEK